MFLDVLVSRDENGAIMAEVYRKPTHTGQYLNYHSYCPLEYMEVIGTTLFRRAKNHSSNLATQCAKEQRILEELKMNGYPVRRITIMKLYEPDLKDIVNIIITSTNVTKYNEM